MTDVAVDAAIAQARKAMQLPDSSFRTEYDMNNALAANLERLEAAASVAPHRVADIDTACSDWRARAESWRTANKAGGIGAGLASADDYLASLAEQDAEAEALEAGEDAGAAGKRKRKTKKDRQAAKAATAAVDADDNIDMGERGTSLEMHLAVLRGEAAPNPRGSAARKGTSSTSRGNSPATTPRTAARRQVEEDERTRGRILTMETLTEPPVVAAEQVVPPHVLSSSAAIRLIDNAATATVVFDEMDTVSDELIAAAAESKRGSSSKRKGGGGGGGKTKSRSPSRPSTPTGALAAGDVAPGTRVDCHVTVLRCVLRALVHLGAAAVADHKVQQATLHEQAGTTPAIGEASTPPSDVACLDVETVAAILKHVTIGTEAKLYKTLKKIKGVTGGAAGGADVNDDEEDAMMMPPPSASGQTAEFGGGAHPHGDGGDDDEGEDENLTMDELSAQLIAEFEAQQAAEAAEEENDITQTVGRTGLPARVPEYLLSATLPGFRNAPMAVLMCHGGSFAGAVFVAGSAVVHKSFTRYVVRKKQGGKQSSAGTGFGSAGSQIRKMQETRWREDVKQILDDWRPLLDCCWAISYVAPGPQNRKILTDFTVDWQPKATTSAPAPIPELEAFFKAARGVFRPSEALKSPVDPVHDPRVMSAPITTHKPTFAEVERIYAAVRHISVERLYREPPTAKQA